MAVKTKGTIVYMQSGALAAAKTITGITAANPPVVTATAHGYANGDVVKITAMNDKLPDFAKRVVDVRGIDMSEFSDEQLAQFVEREKYLQEREQRLGVTDETLAELTEWLRGLEF